MTRAHFSRNYIVGDDAAGFVDDRTQRRARRDLNLL
jgi:hypothetical protein